MNCKENLLQLKWFSFCLFHLNYFNMHLQSIWFMKKLFIAQETERPLNLFIRLYSINCTHWIIQNKNAVEAIFYCEFENIYTSTRYQKCNRFYYVNCVHGMIWSEKAKVFSLYICRNWTIWLNFSFGLEEQKKFQACF